VLDVMAIDESRVGAAGEAAAGVAGLERAAHGGWNRARLAADVEWGAVFAFNDRDEARVATQAADGGRGKARAVLDVAATFLGLVAQHGLVDVHRHDVSFAGGERSGALGEERLAYQAERIGLAGRVALLGLVGSGLTAPRLWRST
jgi:hypothetical protein